MLIFNQRPFYIIPSVRQIKDLKYALSLDIDYILLSQVHIGNLQSFVSVCHQAGKKVIVNLDLIGGLGTDKIAMKFLKQLFHVDVVLATNTSKVNMLRGVGIDTIQRITIMDSLSIDSGISAMKDTRCSTIELRPGVYALEYFERFSHIKEQSEFILGGFVNNANLIEQAYRRGFKGITTSTKELWNYKITK